MHSFLVNPHQACDWSCTASCSGRPERSREILDKRRLLRTDECHASRDNHVTENVTPTVEARRLRIVRKIGKKENKIHKEKRSRSGHLISNKNENVPENVTPTVDARRLRIVQKIVARSFKIQVTCRNSVARVLKI